MPGFWRKCRIAFRCARFAVWAAVLLALAAFAWFNLVGLPSYPSAYDKFLISVGLVFNVVTVWTAWNWA